MELSKEQISSIRNKLTLISLNTQVIYSEREGINKLLNEIREILNSNDENKNN
jgi:hypothetical protein